MGLFKRRTTKSVGKDIGRSIGRQQVLAKNLRTLQKEEEERVKETKLKTQISDLKSRRPTLAKKVLKVAMVTHKKLKKRNIAQRKALIKRRKTTPKVKAPQSLNEALYG